MNSAALRGLLLAALLTASACADPQLAGLTTQADQFDLALGQSVDAGRDNLFVTFHEVLEDSRCPQDVVCVWAGRARVVVGVDSGAGDQRYTLTLGEQQAEDTNRITLDGLVLMLLDVRPYPLSSQGTDPESYEITLGIR